jgi:PAS domain S-box-containing protein
MPTLSADVAGLAQRLYDVAELSERIRRGERFFLAGDEAALRRLPQGYWVGGTIPYFMAEDGGLMTRNKVFATEIPSFATAAEIRVYDEQSLFGVYREAPPNGFSLIVMPAQSRTHQSFALNALRYDNFASRPLIGWVSGVSLPELGHTSPKVFDGRDGRVLEDAAIVMHVSLPRGKTADVGLINLFAPGDGDVLTFTADSFRAKEVLVGGVRRDFVEYAREMELDTRLPLVADCNGAMVNISFQGVDEASGEMKFYAPVFEGVEYRHARPVGDYVETFASQIPDGIDSRIAYSCNCILNYVHAGLEGRRTAGITGPFTFGEIAYQLLNQTLVYLTISDTSLADRLRVDAPLRRQYQFLETTVDTIPNPVFYKDAQGRYLGCNKAYADFFGRPKEWIVGKTAYEVLPRELADEHHGLDEEVLRGADRGVHELQSEVRNAAGKLRCVIVHKAAVFGTDGRVAGLVGSLSDITESRRSEQRLTDAYENLKSAQEKLIQSQKMAAVGQLAAGVAHEINNPLGVILGFAQSVCRKLKDEDALALPLRSIEREALRCRNLVQNLLVFSRASGPDRFVETDVGGVVEAAVSLLGPRAKIENSDLRVERADGLPPVLGNANQLQQVLLNLTGNAMDAMPQGGRIDLLTRRSEKRTGHVEIVVRDTGAGIPENIRSRVFEPFFTTKEVGKGTGLGLALVYEIVQKHGGVVDLESEVGKGTTFVVSLPSVVGSHDR